MIFCSTSRQCVDIRTFFGCFMILYKLKIEFFLLCNTHAHVRYYQPLPSLAGGRAGPGVHKIRGAGHETTH